jgi:hypothetical protein
MRVGLGQRVRPLLISVGVAIVIASGPIVAAVLQGQFNSDEFSQCGTPGNSEER